jgi:hypothetical protein
MVYVVPLTYTARIPFTANGKRFNKGDVLTDDEARVLKLGALVSGGRLIATPDTSARTQTKTPLPTYVHPDAYPEPGEPAP